MVDGEIIALNERGLPDFRMLAERIHVRKATTVARLAQRVPAYLMVFDLLRHGGEDLTEQAAGRAPRAAGGTRPRRIGVAAAAHVRRRRDDLRATRSQELEGIVSKRLDSRYRPGERTRNWLKFAHRHRASYVVGGWRPQTGGTHLAALLVGQPTADGPALPRAGRQRHRAETVADARPSWSPR